MCGKLFNPPGEWHREASRWPAPSRHRPPRSLLGDRFHAVGVAPLQACNGWLAYRCISGGRLRNGCSQGGGMKSTMSCGLRVSSVASTIISTLAGPCLGGSCRSAPQAPFSCAFEPHPWSGDWAVGHVGGGHMHRFASDSLSHDWLTLHAAPCHPAPVQQLHVVS